MQTERLSKNISIPPWIFEEHMARFNFASQFVKNRIVVDCACGSGIGSDIFAKAGAKEVWGFDSNEKEIERLSKTNSSPLIKFRPANGLKLPVPNNFAEVYISLETIEHINEDKAYLKEAKRILKNGGIFICSTPNREITNPGKNIFAKPWNKFHVREYSEREFINLVGEYFTVSSIYGQNYASFSKTKIMHILGKILPFGGASWINKFLKLPQFIIKNPGRHQIAAKKENLNYEYLIIVSKKNTSSNLSNQ